MARIGREFIKKTKYEYLDPSAQSRGRAQPPLELETHKSGDLIELPAPETLSVPPVDLRQAIERRSSVRKYSRNALTLEELSFLLWCTQGIKEVIPGSATFRTVPSAGARHALETYLLVNNVQTLYSGLYWYSALRHGLILVDDGESLADRLVTACLGQQFVAQSAVTFIWTAASYRMTWRYSERGYRYFFLDAGHVCQNLYLAAEAIESGVCAIAAFSDDGVNEFLQIDGEEQFSLYLATVGKK
ncbi:MAG: SagB/ThcOx family dehydrogenase [Spirochaetaceae bacterium]|nr:MAG: SagB/ThcOx family dehydrogenase [Spirochaetaceae bacterium]